MSTVVLLARTELFRRCTAEELEELAATAYPMSFERGDLLCEEGGEALECYVVVEGEATVTIGGQAVATVGEGDVVGERGPLEGRVRTATVTAATHMITYALLGLTAPPPRSTLRQRVDGSMARPEEIHLAGSRLRRHRHLCAFFHTLDERYRVLVPFVQEGLARGEKAVHIVDPARRAEHLERLRAGGIDVHATQATGQLEIRGWNETYLRGGRFDQNATLAFVDQVLRDARNEGFPRTRVIGDMEWALQDRPGVGDLVEYEARVNTVFANHPDPLLCTYDRTRFGAPIAMDVFGAHPEGVIGGVLQENPLFGAPVALRRGRHPSDTALLRNRYLAALLAGDRRDALDILVEEGLWLDVPVTSLYLGVLQPALHEIGRLWQHGRIPVARASLAAEISKAALAGLHPLLPCEPSNGQPVVVACVEGELHDIGAHMVADFLEMAGFDVRYLGANVPTESLVALVEEQPPQLLALSATSTGNLGALRRAVKAVSEATKGRVAIAAGGQVFARQRGLRRRLAETIRADTAAELVSAARRLLDGAGH